MTDASELSQELIVAARERHEALLVKVLHSFAASCGVQPRVERTALVADCRSGGVLDGIAALAPEVSRVIAVDGRRSMVDAARERVRRSGDERTFVSMHSAASLPFAAGIFSLLVDLRPHADAAELEQVARSFARLAGPGARLLLLVPAPESAPLLHALVDEFVRSPGGRDLVPALEAWRAGQSTEDGGAGALERAGWQVLDSATLGFRAEAATAEALLVLQDEVLGPVLPRLFTGPLDRSAAMGWLRLALARYFEGRAVGDDLLWNAYLAERVEGAEE